MKKPLASSLLLSLLIFNLVSLQPCLAYSHQSAVKNVIILIGDGMGVAHVEITKLVYGHLNMEDFPVTGLELTDSLSGEVTDSAAAGTAIATGVKTYNGMISVTNVTGRITNVTTLLEVAQTLGKSTGLVTTTRITHATPAVFASHVPDRDMEDEIARQLILHRVNVLLGGGKKEFDEDTLKMAEDYGYNIVFTKEELEKSEGDFILGLFADSHIPYVLDREPGDVGLLDMTKKAISVLERNPNGFFLMVEGGRIDHAAHENDIGSVVAETKEFDDVVGYILEYARKRGDTLVIVLADHETGGLAIGLTYGNSVNEKAIKGIKASASRIASEIKVTGDIRGIFKKYADFEPTIEEIAYIKKTLNSTDRYALQNAVVEIINRRVGVGFVSHKHTGAPVPLLAYGPGSENFGGFLHHVDTAKLIAKLMLFGRENTPITISGVSGIKGDITGDSEVDRRDAYITLMMLLGENVDNEAEKRVDMDRNGMIDLKDVLLILQES
ncbi:MAG: alkaline phosphatase [Thermococcaceae archaeon]|nr:alkaline phosphatase [Thermococcaceae archaeon]MDN5320179.1 alkaline phosphatase [Thermococcaceae archaeon]